MTPAAVGIDVGGTKIAGAVVEANGKTCCEEMVATPRDDVDRATLTLIDQLTEGAAAQGQSIEGVGVGVPEYVTPGGTIKRAVVLPSLQGLPIVTASGTPIVLDSDVRCAARAEARFGHGRTLPSFVFVIIGTGISSTFVLDGDLWTGHRGEAIALGELPVDLALALRPEAPLTVEEQASGRAVSEAIEVATRRRGNPPGDNRDEASIRARAGEIVATGLDSVVHLLDPAAVVVGGGLGTSGGPFFESLSRSYRKLTGDRPDPPPLLQAHLGPHAGVIGAGLLGLSDEGLGCSRAGYSQ